MWQRQKQPDSSSDSDDDLADMARDSLDLDAKIAAICAETSDPVGEQETAAVSVNEGSNSEQTPETPTTSTAASGRDTRKWFPLKFVATGDAFPPSVNQLFNNQLQYETKTISRFEFVSTLANLCMVETGFVPLTTSKELVCHVDELMGLSVQLRMNKMIDVLAQHAKEKHNLKEVYYKYIKRVDNSEERSEGTKTESTTPEVESFEYSAETLKLTTWHQVDTFVTLKADDEAKTFKLEIIYRYVTGISNWERLPLPRMAAKFRTQEFVADMKRRICYYFNDKLNNVCPESLPFDMLPDELIENLARYLDMKSVVHFATTCNRMKTILDTEASWKALCQKIPHDFGDYGLTAPSASSLRTSLSVEGRTYKDKYKTLFVDAARRDDHDHGLFFLRRRLF